MWMVNERTPWSVMTMGRLDQREELSKACFSDFGGSQCAGASLIA